MTGKTTNRINLTLHYRLGIEFKSTPSVFSFVSQQHQRIDGVGLFIYRCVTRAPGIVGICNRLAIKETRPPPAGSECGAQ